MNFFERILYVLQYETTRPTTYGIFHICWLVASIILIIILYKRKENNHERTLKRILCIYGFGALILEILKQLIWSLNYDTVTNVVTWDYQWYAFPFQLCTTPIFISIICAFLKKGKLRDNLLSFMAYVTILGSIATAIYPESCFVRTLLVDIHTMYLHFGSLVVSIYLLTKKEVEMNFKTLIKGYGIFLIFVLIAEALNIIIYQSGVLNGETFNMFFISPYFISTLPVYDIIQSNTSFIVYILFYLVTTFIGALIIWSISKLISKLTKSIKNIQSGTIKYLVFLIIATTLFGLILYPLFDLIICKVITNTQFSYSISKHLIRPIVFAIVYGITFWILDKKRK